MEKVQGATGPEAEAVQEKTVEATDKGEKPTVATVKTFTEKQLEEEKAKVQSAFEKKANEARRLADAEARRARELETRTEALQKRLEEVEASKLREWEESVGGTDEGQRLIAQRRRLDEMEKRLQERERAAHERYTAGEYGLKMSHALDLSKQYGVDTDALMEAKDQTEMKALAAELKTKKLEEEIEKLKKAPPAEIKTETTEGEKEEEGDELAPAHLDSGVRTTATPRKLFSLSEIENMSPEDYKKNADAIRRQLFTGKFKKE